MGHSLISLKTCIQGIALTHCHPAHSHILSHHMLTVQQSIFAVSSLCKLQRTSVDCATISFPLLFLILASFSSISYTEFHIFFGFSRFIDGTVLTVTTGRDGT